MAQMLAAASIWAIDALFGLVARNDAECYKRELLGRSWRRDWGMLNFQHFLCPNRDQCDREQCGGISLKMRFCSP